MSVTYAETAPRRRSKSIPVWDAFVRLFHWSLVLSIATALLTGLWLGASWFTLHLIGGTLAVALVTGRIFWGFWGSSFARFAAFVVGPRRLVEHLRELAEGRAGRHIGHNPPGGWMILALLGTILVIGASGVVALGGTLKTGPLAVAVDYATGALAQDLHGALAWGLVGLIVLHVAGAVFESLRTGENLPRAMITGTKELRDEAAELPPHPARTRPALVAGLTAGAVVLGAASTLAVRQLPVPGAPMPPARFDRLYADECSACHIAYHPSLLPPESWGRLMATLDDHFGEDASLDAASTRAIAEWLTAAAARPADTKPAREFARVNPAAPFTITKTPFWQETHAAISEATFSRKPIYGKFNCGACHRDAESGWFYPGNIDIPDTPKENSR